jgi:RNA polymerase sigma factor (TIGR02999 family)
MAAPHAVTRLLADWRSGDQSALEQLMALLYGELRALADSHLRSEGPGCTLQPTALVHEAYLRLVSQHLPDWKSRSHFFGVAAQLMRQVLVDRARAHHAEKRGGGRRQVPLEDTVCFAPERSRDLVALDDALKELAALDHRKSKVVELRFFGGLEIEEIAEVLDLSAATVGRELRVARAWLYRAMRKD